MELRAKSYEAEFNQQEALVIQKALQLMLPELEEGEFDEDFKDICRDLQTQFNQALNQR